jgi:hypothetical protein
LEAGVEEEVEFLKLETQELSTLVLVEHTEIAVAVAVAADTQNEKLVQPEGIRLVDVLELS